MNTIKILLICALIAFLGVPAYAQNELTDEDKEELQIRTKVKVEEFQNYLSNIVNTSLTDRQREASIASALVLFIGGGDPYTVKIEDDKGNTFIENRKAVRMQLSSINNYSKRWLPMKIYLQNQYNNVHKYGRVTIQSADAVRVDRFSKTADGHYEAVAYFCQKYMAYRDGKVVYADIVIKKIKVYVDALETPDGVIWEVKLGDVYVTSTNPAGN